MIARVPLRSVLPKQDNEFDFFGLRVGKVPKAQDKEQYFLNAESFAALSILRRRHGTLFCAAIGGTVSKSRKPSCQ